MMSSNGFAQFLIGIPWFAWIAIVAIVCESTAKIVKNSQRHFERMALIRMGLHPDAPADPYAKGVASAEV
jgi:hypothetical protein